MAVLLYNAYDVRCVDHDTWVYLQENYGWDQDNDGYEVFVPGQYEEADRQLIEALDRNRGSSSKSSSKKSSATNANTGTSKSAKCEHNYIAEVTTLATCSSEGVTTYTCSKCGDVYTESIPVDANAHDWNEPVRVEPTCAEKGTITKTCKLCGKEEVEEIPALGHDYVESVTKEPTCTDIGIKTFTCARCNDSYTENIPALGHIEGDWVIDKEASLFFEGSKHKVCTRCNEILITEVIPSRYPTWYLYALIGIGVIIVGVIIGIVIKKRNNRGDDNAIDEQKALDMLKNA